MKISTSVLTALAGSALGLAAAAYAVPVPFPTYTFCEEEGNDTCPDAQVLDASAAAAAVGGGGDGEAVRDCFYITGKLQQDCVWDIEPKCAINVYDKRKPCRDEDGDLIPNQFYEPILAMSTGADLVVPASQYPDRVLRLGIAALFDKVDGTINGLAGNGPHHEIGEVTVKIFYGGGGGDGRGDEPDQEYVFKFGAGAPPQTGSDDVNPVRGLRNGVGPISSDAVRAAFVIPAGVQSVRVVCCDDTGTVPLCWDVDFYEIRNLIPGAFYAVEQVGGLTDVTDADSQADCVATNTKLGWFDKQCFLVSKDDNSGADDVSQLTLEELANRVYPKLYAAADENGTLRVGVSAGQRVQSIAPVILKLAEPIPDFAGGSPGVVEVTVTADPPSPSLADAVIKDVSHMFIHIVHTWVGDLRVSITHEDTGTTAFLINRPGVPPTTFGSSANLVGSYEFSDLAATSLAAAALGPPVPAAVPTGLYRPATPLSVFEGESPFGDWTIRITDHAAPDTGRLNAWSMIFNAPFDTGDCDFDGLRDDRQDDYRDLLEEINLFTGSNYVYTPGASVKDESVGGVNRYPRRIWDPFHPSTNPDGFGFLEWFGGPPERFAAHGVCGGYCLKVQLAEHIGTRPNFPTAMAATRVDMNQDGVINATDLALLLSYWGVVQ